MIAPRIIAHRGGSDVARENTIVALRTAMERGADGVELDVQLTADGEVLVYHDGTLPNTGSGATDRVDFGRGIGKLSLAQIRRWQAAISDAADLLPKLSDVLAAIGVPRPNQTIVIDLKSAPWNAGDRESGLRLIDAVLPIVSAYPCKNCVVLGSFDWNALTYAAAKITVPRIAFHTIAARWLEGRSARETNSEDVRDVLAYQEAWRQRQGTGAEALSLLDMMNNIGARIWSCYHRDLTEGAIERARTLGLETWTWTVNTESDLRRVASLGVDAITTDRPELALTLLNQRLQEDRHGE